MKWLQLNARAHPDLLGFIPSFLDEEDPDPAVKQLDKNYQSGWRPSAGWTMRPSGTVEYEGEPPLAPLFASVLRNEVILVYQYGYVAVVQPDGTFELCRMD